MQGEDHVSMRNVLRKAERVKHVFKLMDVFLTKAEGMLIIAYTQIKSPNNQILI